MGRLALVPHVFPKSHHTWRLTTTLAGLCCTPLSAVEAIGLPKCRHLRDRRPLCTASNGTSPFCFPVLLCAVLPCFRARKEVAVLPDTHCRLGDAAVDVAPGSESQGRRFGRGFYLPESAFPATRKLGAPLLVFRRCSLVLHALYSGMRSSRFPWTFISFLSSSPLHLSHQSIAWHELYRHKWQSMLQHQQAGTDCSPPGVWPPAATRPFSLSSGS